VIFKEERVVNRRTNVTLNMYSTKRVVYSPQSVRNETSGDRNCATNIRRGCRSI